MYSCEGSPSGENGSCNRRAKSAPTDAKPEILGPEQTRAFGPLSSLHDYGISFWAYCTASGRTFLLGPDGIATGSTPGYFQSPGRTLVDDDRDIVASALAEMAGQHNSSEVRFRVKDETGAIRWSRCVGRRLPGKFPVRIGGVLMDITAEIEALEVQDQTMRELQHRLNNQFAVISGIARGLAKQMYDAPGLAEELCGRLTSLAKAHSLLWESGELVPLGDLLATILEPYRNLAHIELIGPSVSILPKAVTPLTLILHEWATNSLKYGSLNGPSEARLSVYWENAQGNLKLLWVEDIPGRESISMGDAGFGSRLLEILVNELHAGFERRIFRQQLAMSLVLPSQSFRIG